MEDSKASGEILINSKDEHLDKLADKDYDIIALGAL